jgi:hypothetical protein
LTTGSNTKTNYYAFGMAMPGRSYQSSNGYRYGMNGQEKDLEIFEGAYTAEYWEYDSRLGRRWNLDPKPTVGISDYACFGNNPIYATDVAGSNTNTPITNPEIGDVDPNTGGTFTKDMGWLLPEPKVTPNSAEDATKRDAELNSPVRNEYEPNAQQKVIYNSMDQFKKGMVVGAVTIFSAPVIAEAGIFGGPLADVFNQKVIQGKSQDEFNYASTATSLIFSGGNMFTSTVLGASGNLINGTKKDFKAGTILQIKNENFVSFGAGILGNTFSGAHMKGIGYAGFAQSKNAKTIFDFGTSALGGAVSNSIESEFPSKK